MHLLYVIAAYGREYLGGEIHRELLREFKKAGHEVSVFAVAGKERQPARTQPTIEDGIAVYRASVETPLDRVLNPLVKPFFHYDRFATAGWGLARCLSQIPKLDLVLAEGGYPFGALAALTGVKPLIVSVAGGDFIASEEANYGYGRFRTARWLMRRAFRRADALRVTTLLVREHAVGLGASSSKINVIPRNIAAYCYPPPDQSLAEFRAAARERIRSRHSIGDARLVVAAGRLLPIKGFDVLVRALPQIVNVAGDTCIMLIGPNRVDSRLGDYQKYLQKLGAELGVANRLIFTGSVRHPNIREYLAAADVVAAPSILEGMNKVAIEAAAVGTPSVVTRTTGIAELMRGADCAEVVNERSPDEFANAVIELLRDGSKREAMGARGVELAKQFTSERIAAQLLELFARVVG